MYNSRSCLVIVGCLDYQWLVEDRLSTLILKLMWILSIYPCVCVGDVYIYIYIYIYVCVCVGWMNVV